MELNELYREVILDHYQSPRGKVASESATTVVDGKNPLCGDEVTLYLTCKDGIVKRVTWQGEGCSICMASTSMLCEALENISCEHANAKIQQMIALMHGTDLPDDHELGDIEVLAGVQQFPVRIKCALLPWTTLQEGMKQQEQANDGSKQHASFSY